ncbi:MAG: DUF4118 domain-containing protein [Chloroflexi bacterium]|nr:DUF4118 domain-containing protein [Chloroflexota bacterium]
MIALLASFIALAVALLSTPIDGDDSMADVMFLAAVGLSGWYGGLAPALVCAFIGALAIDYFFELPPYTLAVSSARTILDVASFLLVAILLGSLNARLRASNEQFRLQRDKAEAAVNARDELMATVSHGLRTPLTVIKGALYTLGDPSIQLSTDEREQLVSSSQAEADRLERFVSETLALRRLENSVSPRWGWIAPSELVSAVLDRWMPSLGLRPIDFCVPGDLPSVRVDAGLIDQALSVLLENVAVYTPPETQVKIDATVRDGELRLTVSDNGPGIPDRDRERVFAKYERLDESSPGLGLGLAIARAAVEVQGGRLWIEDAPLGGATFVLAVPAAGPPTEATRAAQ